MGEKRKLLQEEYAEVKRKKTEEEDIVANLEKSVNKYITLAAAEEDHVKLESIVVKMNSFKETISKKKVILSELDTALSHLEKEISSCK